MGTSNGLLQIEDIQKVSYGQKLPLKVLEYSSLESLQNIKDFPLAKEHATEEPRKKNNRYRYILDRRRFQGPS